MSAPKVDVLAVMRRCASELETKRMRAGESDCTERGMQEAIDSVAEMIATYKESLGELVRIRHAAMIVCCAVENGTDVIKHADALLTELDKPWSVDRSRSALARIGAES